jgi:hypothetical protein
VLSIGFCHPEESAPPPVGVNRWEGGKKSNFFFLARCAREKTELSQNALFVSIFGTVSTTSPVDVFSREARKIWRFLDEFKQKHA